MSHSESQSDAPTKTMPEPPPVHIDRPPVHIDRKGRLSVKTADLATSDAFRAQLGGMVKLAKTHPPKAPTT